MLAATHRLEQMRRLGMLEEQAGFDRIENTTETCEQHFLAIENTTETCEHHFLAGFDSEPLYTKLYNPRWPHSREDIS